MKSSAGEAPAPGNGARNSGQQLDPRENVIEDNYHLPIRRDIKDAEMQFADGASVSRILLWAIPKQKEKAIARLVNNNRGQSPIIGCGFMEYNREALGEEREVVVGRNNWEQLNNWNNWGQSPILAAHLYGGRPAGKNGACPH
jgi:hypothetical protein